MGVVQRIRNRNRLQFTAVILTSLLTAYTLIGFWIVPWVGRWTLERHLTSQLHRNVSIHRIRFNPFTLTFAVLGFQMADRETGQPFLKFRSLAGNLESVSLFKGGPVVREIRIDDPWFDVVRREDGTYNFSDLLSNDTASGTDDTPENAPAFSFNNIQIRDGTVLFADGPHGAVHEIQAISIDLPFVSSFAYDVDHFVQPRFSARINRTLLSLEGRTKPFADAVKTQLDVNLAGIHLPTYFNYLPDDLPFRLKSGTVDVNGHLGYVKHADRATSVGFRGSVLLKDLALEDRDQRPLLTAHRVHLVLTDSDFISGRIHIEACELEGATVHVTRLPRGGVNLHEFYPRSHARSDDNADARLEVKVDRVGISDARLRFHPAEIKAAADGSPDSAYDLFQLPMLNLHQVYMSRSSRNLTIEKVQTRGGRLVCRRLADGRLDIEAFSVSDPVLPASDSGGRPRSTPAFEVTLGEITLEDYGVQGQNWVPDNPAVYTISDISATAIGLSTARDRSGAVDAAARINGSGNVRVVGELSLVPLGFTLAPEVEAVDLAALSPLIHPFPELVVTRGVLSAAGRFTLSTDGTTGAVAAGFQGDMTIADAAAAIRNTEFLAVDALDVRGIEAALPGPTLTVAEIGLTSPALDLTVDRGGRWNLPPMQAAAENPKGKGNAPNPASSSTDAGTMAPTVVVDHIDVTDGRIRLTDHSVSPRYAAEISDLEATVTNAGMHTNRPVAISATGRYNRKARMQLTGRLTPLDPMERLDLDVTLANLDLTSLSPYSGKYIGKTIQKGRFGLDMGYRIRNSALEASHRVTMDQLFFGSTVDSPNATDLPVDLAVALLKDRSGKIELDLPVSGRLDDPEFSLAGAVFQMIGNVVTKAATSPFDLIAGMAGGAELNRLHFGAGRADLTPTAIEKLDALSEALYDRPGVKLGITGFVDPETDTQALIETRLNSSLRAVKYATLPKSKAGTLDPDSVQVTSDEYDDMLWRVYKAEVFEKPKNFIGMTRRLPSVEMRKRLLDHFRLADGALATLAEMRAQAVEAYLLSTGKVAAERLALVTPATIDTPPEEGQIRSRVELALRRSHPPGSSLRPSPGQSPR